MATDKIINRGVLLGQRDTDWVAGVIPFEEINPSGNWTPHLPPGEWQTNHVVDTMACVTFSALNSIETQIKFLTGQSINYSDRFTAKMSGTTPQGNWLYKVAPKDGTVFGTIGRGTGFDPRSSTNRVGRASAPMTQAVRMRCRSGRLA